MTPLQSTAAGTTSSGTSLSASFESLHAGKHDHRDGCSHSERWFIVFRPNEWNVQQWLENADANRLSTTE